MTAEMKLDLRTLRAMRALNIVSRFLLTSQKNLGEV